MLSPETVLMQIDTCMNAIQGVERRKRSRDDLIGDEAMAMLTDMHKSASAAFHTYRKESIVRDRALVASILGDGAILGDWAHEQAIDVHHVFCPAGTFRKDRFEKCLASFGYRRTGAAFTYRHLWDADNYPTFRYNGDVKSLTPDLFNHIFLYYVHIPRQTNKTRRMHRAADTTRERDREETERELQEVQERLRALREPEAGGAEDEALEDEAQDEAQDEWLV